MNRTFGNTVYIKYHQIRIITDYFKDVNIVSSLIKFFMKEKIKKSICY